MSCKTSILKETIGSRFFRERKWGPGDKEPMFQIWLVQLRSTFFFLINLQHFEAWRNIQSGNCNLRTATLHLKMSLYLLRSHYIEIRSVHFLSWVLYRYRYVSIEGAAISTKCAASLWAEVERKGKRRGGGREGGGKGLQGDMEWSWGT